MKQRRQRKKHRFFATLLCFCMLFTMPGVQNVFPVIAAGQEENFRQESIITAFAPLSGEVKEQTVFTGTDRDELDLPQELTVCLLWESSEQKVEKSEQENTGETDNIEENSDTETKDEQDTQTEESEISGETDDSTETDNENAADSEDNESSERLPEGYALMEGVSLPEITVTVESGADAMIQALHDRIAALPDAEEYLASEPDMEEDEDAYTEWEEKLYELCKEALAIWEEYEALTEEQQMQILEEELVKLTAWVEIAETLTESCQVMAVDGSTHTHCFCGGNIKAGDHTGHTDNFVYDKILTSNGSRQLLIDGEVKENYTLTSGSYYLGDDVTLNSELIIEDNSTVYICLNGKKLENINTTGCVICVGKGSTFTLCDCDNSEKGCIREGKGHTDTDGKFRGGAIYMYSKATFNMFGGVIIQNEAENGGGAIYSAGNADEFCTVNIYGGEIKNNSTKGQGGGILTLRTHIKVFGGNFEENTAGTQGGGIYVDGDIIISDASIINNKANQLGGGICSYTSAVFSISGAVDISGNTGKNGAVDNVFFRTGLLFNVIGNLEGSSIGVTPQKLPTSATPAPVQIAGGKGYGITPTDWSCFFSDKEAYEILRKETTEEIDSVKEPRNELWLALPGSCDLGGLNLSTDGATLSPSFDPSITEYTSTVANSVDQVGITATLADTASGADIKIRINDVDAGSMDSGDLKTVDLVEGKNTIAITVTSGELSKTYTIEITREANANYKVTYNKDGGTIAGESNFTEYTYGTGLTLPIPIKMGYTFDGWYEQSDFSGSEVTSISKTDTGAKTYYAKWSANTYTVTYNGNGSTGGSTADSTHTYGTATALTANGFKREYTVTFNPNYTGSSSTSKTAAYTFAGWNTKADGSGTSYDDKASANNLTETNNGTVTLYAQWTSTSKSVTYTPTRAGYTFAGWYTDASCSGSRADSDGTYTPTKDMTLYAKWTPIIYTISCELNGGTATGNPNTYTIESNAITLVNPSKTGYSFGGWSGTDLTGSNNMSVTIAAGSTGNRTYTAHWELKGYTVLLHTNGGTGGTNLTAYTYGTATTLPTDWQKTGYVFDGWYDNENFTGIAVTNISGTATGDKEYWAKWTDNIAPVIGTLTYNYQPKNFWHWLIGKDSLIITVPVTEEGSGADEITYTVTPDGGTASTKTAAIQNGEAKITVSADFKGTISIACTDKANNISASVTVGAGVAPNGIIIEDNAPQIAFQAANAELLNTGEYKTAPNITVTVADDKDNAISGGIASISYKKGNGSEKTVAHDYTTSMVVNDSFTIPASEIPAGETVISVTATDNAGNSSTQKYTVKVHIHNGTLVPAVAPTCTTAGNKEYYTCTCGKWFSDSGCTNEITDKSSVTESARGHDFSGEYLFDTVGHWKKCSRCAETTPREEHHFETDGTQCTVCDYEKEGQGHTHRGELHAGVAPTCTTKGNTAYYTCNCGRWFSDSGCTVEITDKSTVEIAALGHDFVMKHDQNEHWQQCSRCSLEQSRGLHVYDNDSDTDCNVCGYVRTIQHTHSATLVPAKPATCTEDGHEAYYTCSCEKWFSDSGCVNEITDHASVTIGKLGHDFSGQYLFDANGHWKVCSRCNTAQTAENHVFDDDNDTTCNKCGYQRTIGTHTHSVGRTVAATEPTCTTAGNKAYYICSCGKWFSDSACTKEVTAQDVTIPAKGHTAVTDPAKMATCTETGLTEGSHCSVCGHVIKAQTVTAALGHNYGKYYRDADGHWKVCSRCGAVGTKHGHRYDNDRDARCKNCGWKRAISDEEQPTPQPPVPPQPTDPQQPIPTPPVPPQPTPQPPSSTNPPGHSRPAEKPDNKPGTVSGTPDNSQPEDKQDPESTGTPEPTVKPSETGKAQQPEGDGEQTVPASMDNGKIAISGEPVATGNVKGMTDTSTVLDLGNGAVIVTVVCAEQEYTAGVADTIAVANAVLTKEQMELVNNGETIEIRIDVKDISEQMPEQDKEVIENGIEEYRKEVPGLVLGMYVDISMFIRIGEGDWNAITTTKEPIGVIIGIPEKLQEKDRAYYIIRAHDGVPTFMNDMDDEPSTITVNTDLFSSYAIAYVQAEGAGHKCSLCHICPTFLGLCCFVWLAITILIMIIVVILLPKKKEEQEV